MELVVKLLTVLGLGAIELWAAVPAGFALQLPPFITAIVAAAGAMLGVMAVLVLGERIRAWLLRRHGGDRNGHGGGIHRVWTRYGVIGLGLLAPLLVGAPLGAALGITLGAPTGRLLLWMTAGIVLWSTLLTTAGALGLAGIESLRP